MNSKQPRTPVSRLHLAFVHVLCGTVLLLAPGTPSGRQISLSYLLLAVMAVCANLWLLGMASWNYLNIWRATPEEASWAFVAPAVIHIAVDLIVATALFKSEEWRGLAILPAAFAGVVLLLLVREVFRLATRSQTADSHADHGAH